MLTTQVQEFAGGGVLCWFAAVDSSGRHIVSPKELFAVFDSEHLVVANIASPASARNVEQNPRVCVSFVDVFAQRGFKVTGVACNVKKNDPDYPKWSFPLVEKAGPRFPIHSVFVVEVAGVEPILAPSYGLYPTETTGESQVASAMRAYGVRPVRGDA
jgi:predicted pyridoxine 5'-phosphate oxidase superfamily flavin-nucleotide-binding protein